MLDTFMKEYEKQLRIMMVRHPEDYRFNLDYVPIVLEKMRTAFLYKTYNKEGLAIQATCKALGIPYTYKGINSYLEKSS